MELKIGTCPKCGERQTIIPSNNNLVQPICTACIIRELDYNDMNDADYFCRTYNFPFKPDVWIRMVKEFKYNVFREYSIFVMKNIDEEYENPNRDLWKSLNEEWQLVKTHHELVMKIEPIKEGYMLRNQIKWGANYTFAELIELENLFINTLEANNVSNPMQIDAIKKACKLSIALDRAITGGESKEINDLSKAYQNFVKTAKIDDLITASSEDVISNVAQLVQYIEDQGFEFNYYDNVDRDIVDKSLKDMQDFIRRLVTDSTGLDVIFDTISSGLKKDDAIKKDRESYDEVPLEELYQSELELRGKEFDEELEKEWESLDWEDEDEDEFF